MSRALYVLIRAAAAVPEIVAIAALACAVALGGQHG